MKMLSLGVLIYFYENSNKTKIYVNNFNKFYATLTFIPEELM